MGRREPYQKISDETRKRVLQAEENGEDAFAVAYANGMKRRTIADLLKRGTVSLNREMAHFIRRFRARTPEVKAFLNQLLEEVLDLTLQQMNDKIFTRFDIQITPQAIGSALDGMTYTLKSLRHESETLNSVLDKGKRFTCSQAIMEREG